MHRMTVIYQLGSPIGFDSNTEPERATGSRESRDLSTFEKLPHELKERVAFFLSTRELLRLAETSKTLSSDLNLSIASSPLTTWTSPYNRFRTRTKPQCFAVMYPLEEAVNQAHSMTFTWNLVSGHAKVAIREHPLPRSRYRNINKLRNRRKNTKEIASLSTRQTKEPKLSLNFNIKPKTFYQFFVHETEDNYVKFSDMTLHRVGFGNPKSTGYMAYQFKTRLHEDPPF